MPSFEVEAVVRGYHIYKEIWNSSIGEELFCAREPTNPRDPFAVAVVKSNQTVGHVPLKISSRCFYGMEAPLCAELLEGDSNTRDLAQGGLVIPCSYLEI